MNISIKNCPDEAWNYEFIVCEGFEDGLVYFKHFKNVTDAEAATRIMSNPIVVHNVRIQGYRDPRPMKRFIFSGQWYWECFAHNLEEAKQKYYDEAGPDDFDFSCSYDDVSEEECES